MLPIYTLLSECELIDLSPTAQLLRNGNCSHFHMAILLRTVGINNNTNTFVSIGDFIDNSCFMTVTYSLSWVLPGVLWQTREFRSTPGGSEADNVLLTYTGALQTQVPPSNLVLRGCSWPVKIQAIEGPPPALQNLSGPASLTQSALPWVWGKSVYQTLLWTTSNSTSWEILRKQMFRPHPRPITLETLGSPAISACWTLLSTNIRVVKQQSYVIRSFERKFVVRRAIFI